MLKDALRNREMFTFYRMIHKRGNKYLKTCPAPLITIKKITVRLLLLLNFFDKFSYNSEDLT